MNEIENKRAVRTCKNGDGLRISSTGAPINTIHENPNYCFNIRNIDFYMKYNEDTGTDYCELDYMEFEPRWFSCSGIWSEPMAYTLMMRPLRWIRKKLKKGQ